MPEPSQRFAELFAESNRALFQFLKTEIELGLTFAAIAERYNREGNLERYEINKQNALKALDAIDRFKGRLSEGDLQEIEVGRSKLEDSITALT
jgi:hypothetical protein